MLQTKNVRSEIDTRNEKIGYKIREHSLMGTPIILIIGEKEEETKKVAIRYLGSNKQEIKLLEEFIQEIELKILPPNLI